MAPEEGTTHEGNGTGIEFTYGIKQRRVTLGHGDG